MAPKGERLTFNVGDPIPLVLTVAQLAALLQVSQRALATYRRERSHPGIRQLEGPGAPRFCGRTLKRWLDGPNQDDYRRYFASARNRAR